MKGQLSSIREQKFSTENEHKQPSSKRGVVIDELPNVAAIVTDSG
jgi:hypothetical protein